jgi:hypothetical protein
MTIREKVSAFIIRLAPESVCDTCIAEKLDLPQRQYANNSTRELAGQAGFERRISQCALCGAEKKVIRRG